uniref:Reverse transcriptase domain-containing protein n=1 Tax=Tanacetum cinerariifolium TaxID=118510 RepID=A0A6L2LS06_TANCI|nr:reverse transcriptase domain-containing protein [Tanacetum cinerariifolium]
MLDSDAYKTYLAYATGAASPKMKRKYNKPSSSSKKRTLVTVEEEEPEPTKKVVPTKKPATKRQFSGVQIRDTPGVSVSKKKAPTKVARSKGIELLYDAALLVEAQLKKALKRRKRKTPIHYVGGLSEGDDFESQVPDEPKGDSTPGIVLGRSFIKTSRGIFDLGKRVVIIYLDSDPFHDNSNSLDDPVDEWDDLLEIIDFGDIPEIDELPPIMFNMGKNSISKAKIKGNYKMTYGDEGPSLKSRPIIETLKNSDQHKKLLDSILLEKLKLDEEIEEGEEEVAKEVIRNYKTHRETNDPGVFFIPIRVEGKYDTHALADTGSNINVLPYGIYMHIGAGEVEAIADKIQMLDHSRVEPIGILRDVLCQVGVTMILAREKDGKPIYKPDNLENDSSKLRTYAERKSDSKRKADDISRSNQQPFKKQNVTNAYNLGSAKGNAPKSTGNTNATNNRGGNGPNPKGNGCFECGNLRHFKRDCPKLNNKNWGNGNAQEWVYTVGNAERNDNHYDVELADGKILGINTIIRGCTLNFLNHPFTIDLMLVELGSFDAIIGMDWLRRHHAVIVCDEKLVRVPFGNETLVFHGAESYIGRESRLTVISCSKVQEYRAKVCHVFLAKISTTKEDDKSEGKQVKDLLKHNNEPQHADDERTDSENQETHDDDEESEDEFVHTPPNYVPTDDETNGEPNDVTEEEYERINEEYGDVNIRLTNVEPDDKDKGDKEMTNTETEDAEHKNFIQESACNQVNDDAQATQKTKAETIKRLRQQYAPQKSVENIQEIKMEHTRKQQVPKETINSSDTTTLAEFDQKTTLFETMTKSKSFNKSSKQRALYHALIESILKDENAMDEGVWYVKDIKEKDKIRAKTIQNQEQMGSVEKSRVKPGKVRA